MTTPKILAFAGSTRSESLNKKLIKVGAEGATAADAAVTLIDLRDYALPLYDGDLEATGMPEAVLKLKKLFSEHDGLLIASPEYNGSIPGPLKNAIDWVSRPAPGEKSLASFADKVAALLSASPGAAGGMRALVHLRASLTHINVLVLPQQVSVSKAHEAFNPGGSLKDAKQQASVHNVAKKLTETIVKLRA